MHAHTVRSVSEFIRVGPTITITSIRPRPQVQVHQAQGPEIVVLGIMIQNSNSISIGLLTIRSQKTTSANIYNVRNRNDVWEEDRDTYSTVCVVYSMCICCPLIVDLDATIDLEDLGLRSTSGLISERRRLGVPVISEGSKLSFLISHGPI